MRFQAPRGTQDVLPGDSFRWQRVETEFRNLTNRYGYRELRTPTFEDTELFIRSSGDTSEVVTKQMYSFEDKGGRNITLKPEGTAPAMRALIEHSLCPPGTIRRLSYCSAFFRYERPQKGRLRELHQLGLELVGSASPLADAEIIEASASFYAQVGIPGVQVFLNTLGKAECRARFQDSILSFASSLIADMDEESQARARKNPLRLLDSKDPKVAEALQDAPPILDFLEDDSKAHFDEVQLLLSDAGIAFSVKPEIVRGLDYYTGTVFEIQSTLLGSQSALCGGGRYDTLLAQIGGPDLPSVGVGMGIERLLIVLEELGVAWEDQKPDAVVAYAGNGTRSKALSLARSLRSSGFEVIVDPDGRSLKAQVRTADKHGARFVVIIGEDEVRKGTATLKHLDTGTQIEMPFDQVAEALRQ